MKKVKKMLLLMLVVSMVILSACNNPTTTTEPASTGTEVVEEKNEITEDESKDVTTPEEGAVSDIREELLAKANEVVIGENDVTFLDDSGREAITIAKNPKKVAVLYGSHACLWTEAGGKVSLGVGGENATQLYIDQIGRNILDDEGVITVADSLSANSWDIEKILSEQPDLIICSTAMSGYGTISGPAEAAGIPVVAITYGGIEDYAKWSKVFANLNSKPEIFEEIAMKTVDDVAQTISKVPTDNNPRVLSILPQSDGVRANLDGSDMGAVMSNLGTKNVVTEMGLELKGTRVDVNLEQIYAADPELILIQSISTEEFLMENMKTLLLDSPIWKELSAVKNDKVYYMPKDLFHYRPNHRYNEAYKMMAEILYPGVEF